MFQPTVPTLKLLPVTITLPFGGVDMSASGTGLRRVRRWHEHNRNACNHRFVLHKDSNLVERPIVGSTPLSFVSRLLVQIISDTCQILKRQCSLVRFCSVHQLLADVVIQPFLKAPFSALEPSQKSSRIPSAFALNIRSDLAVSVASGLNPLAAPTIASRSCGDVSASQIHTDNFGCLTRGFSENINAEIDVVISLLGFVQRRRCGDLPFQQGKLIVANQELKLFPSTDQRDSDRLLLFVYNEEKGNVLDLCILCEDRTVF